MDTSEYFRLYKFSFVHILFIMGNMNTMTTVGAVLMRCYCNLPECTNSYYCQSRAGCFQELPNYNTPRSTLTPIADRGHSTTAPHLDPGRGGGDLRYGCLELWPSDSAPFQCTEPGIRKLPLVNGNGGRRHIAASLEEYEEMEEEMRNGRIKNSDARRRRPIGNRQRNHHNAKMVQSRPWSSYDVPLRCCTGDMCNRRGVITDPGLKLSNKIAPSRMTTVSPGPQYQPAPTTVTATSQNWWLASSMIFVPVIGGLAFFLLVLVGCWILHYGAENPCRTDGGREKLVASGPLLPVPTYFIYQSDHTNTDSVKDNLIKSQCKCVLVETRANAGPYLHVPIVLAKTNADCVVNVKTANLRASLR